MAPRGLSDELDVLPVIDLHARRTLHQRLQDNGGNTAALSIEECLQCVEGLPVSLDSDGNVKALENDAGERPPEDFHRAANNPIAARSHVAGARMVVIGRAEDRNGFGLAVILKHVLNLQHCQQRAV